MSEADNSAGNFRIVGALAGVGSGQSSIHPLTHPCLQYSLLAGLTKASQFLAQVINIGVRAPTKFSTGRRRTRVCGLH